MALFVATGFGAVSVTLLQTVPADTSIDRLLRLSHQDAARRALGRGPAEAGWTSLMIDRTALLLPRLALSKRSYPHALDEMVRHRRIGPAIGGLRTALGGASGEIGDQARQVLAQLFESLTSGRDINAHEAAGLGRRVKMLTSLAVTDANEGGLRLFDPLLDLRHALASTAATDPERAA